MADEKTFQEVLAFLEKRRARTDEDVFAEYLAQKPQGQANAVEVPLLGLPRPVFMEEFPKTPYLLTPSDMVLLCYQAGFSVSCYSLWRDEGGLFNRVLNRFTGMHECRGTCLVCGYQDGAAPLTNEQAQALCDMLARIKIRYDRGER